MTFDLARRRLVRAANGCYLFDRIPVVHCIVLLVQMALLARLTSRFNVYFEQRPVLTMMVSNAVLCGVADTVAQTITTVRTKQAARRKASSVASGLPRPAGSRDQDVELRPMSDRKPSSPAALTQPSYLPASISAPPPPLDLERLTRFVAYGFGMAPLQFRWFRLLERAFPLPAAAKAAKAAAGVSSLLPALKRVAFDQLVFAPFGVAVFFTAMTLAEGGGRRAVVAKMRDMYLPTLKANYMLWPAVQMINFRLMPVQFQLPFVSTVGIAWTAYLSLSNSTEDAQLARKSEADSVRLED